MQLLKTSALSASQVVIKMLAGFIVLKIVANITGPVGVALLGQMQNLITTTSLVGGGALGTGLTKYGAEYHAQPADKFQIYVSGFKLTLIISFIISFIILIMSKIISNYLFEGNYQILVILLGIFLPLISLNIVLLAAINGEGAVKKLVFINIISSFIILALTAILTIYFQVYGAFLAMIITPAIIFFIAFEIIKREYWVKKFFIYIKKISINKIPKAKILLKFASTAFIGVLMYPLSQIIIRWNIGEQLSWRDAGLWQGVNRISEVYLAIITLTFSTYLLPKMSSTLETKEVVLELKKIITLSMPITIILAGGIYIFRESIVLILFNKDFIEMKDLFMWQLMGDVLKVPSWILGYVLLAKAQIKVFIIGEITFTFTYIIISYLMMIRSGLIGVTEAHFINYILYLTYVTLAVYFMINKLNKKDIYA